MSARSRMSNVDAAWLGMDSPENLMMVTAVLFLDAGLDDERLTDVLQHRLLDRFPKFSQRPLPSQTPLEQPVWTDDPDFDLSRHLVRAGRRHGDAGIADLVSDLLGTPLDMAHPPWQFHFVELVDDESDAGARTVIVTRLHHCIADGIALASVLLSLTDEDPDVPANVVADEVATNVRDPRRPGLRARVTDGAAEVAAATGAIQAAPTRAARIRQIRDQGRFWWRVLTTGLGLLFANRDPRTRLRGRLGARKGAAWTGRLDLASVKQIATGLDVTVNDVLLAVTAGALRRHLVAHGDRPHDLRVFVPVNLRPPDRPVPVSLGNRFGIVFIRLPVSEPDPVARVRRVHRRMGAVKAGPQAAAMFAILSIVGGLPTWGHRLAVRILGAKSSAVVTNVPGPREPVFLAGTRLDRLVFWVPQAGSVGLGVSILSYAGEVTIGVAADRRLVPDPARITADLEAELSDLLRLATGPEAITIEVVGIDSQVAAELIIEVQQEYVTRYGGPDDTPIVQAEFAAPGGTFFVARVDDELVGCAGLRRHGDGAELKRMYIRPGHRRRGYARAMLAALEDWARAHGYLRLTLETGSAQPEAVALYLSSGYQQVENFGYYKDSPLVRSFSREL